MKLFADSLCCKPGDLPFRYLGLPAGANPRKSSAWKPVIDSVRKGLNAWKLKLLSFGARITLVKSVLSSLPAYFFSLFKAPKKALYISRGKQEMGGTNMGMEPTMAAKPVRMGRGVTSITDGRNCDYTDQPQPE